MKIVQYPDPILLNITETVSDFEEAQNINLQLRAAVRLSGGLIGLAANQIGIAKQVCIVGLESGDWITLVNPIITETGGPMVPEVEGCGSLSEPERLLVKVSRPDQISLKFQSTSGQTQTLALQGFDARVAQHEIDHLNGKMILDYGPGFTDDSY